MVARLTLSETHEGTGATLRDAMGFELPWHYGDAAAEYRAAREHVVLVDRSYAGFLSVTGPEASTFLDRLISAEVARLAPGQGVDAVLLSPKGKVVGVFETYLVDENDYVLRFNDPIPVEFSKILEKYAFLSDVQIIDDSEEKCRFGIEGPASAGLVKEIFGVEPAGASYRREVLDWQDDQTVVYHGGVRRERDRVEIELSSDAAPAAWEVLTEAVRTRAGCPMGFEAAEIIRVEDGQPRFSVDFDADSFPNEAGFEGALTYSKCYVGQEVVARMRTYGHANRVLRGITIVGDPALDTVRAVRGASLWGEGGQVGTITSSVLSPQYAMIALSVVHRKGWAKGTTLRVETASGDVAGVVNELPFTS